MDCVVVVVVCVGLLLSEVEAMEDDVEVDVLFEDVKIFARDCCCCCCCCCSKEDCDCC